MGAYIINASTQEITHEIITFIKEEGLDHKTSLQKKETTIEATGRVSIKIKPSKTKFNALKLLQSQKLKKLIDVPLQIHWNIFACNTQCKIELKVLPFLLIRGTFIAAFIIPVLITLLLCLPSFLKILSGEMPRTSIKWLIIFPPLLVLDTLWYMFIYWRITEWEKSFWEKLMDKHGGKELVEPVPEKDDSFMLLLGIICAAFLLIFASIVKPLLLLYLIATPALLTWILTCVFRKTPLIQWKMSMVELSSKLIGMNITILIIFFFFYILRILFFALDYSWTSGHFKGSVLAKGLTALYYPPAMSQNLNYIEKSVQKQFSKIKTKLYHRQNKAKTSTAYASENKSFDLTIRKLMTISILVLAGYFALFAIANILETFLQILTLARSWEKSATIAKPYDVELLLPRSLSIVASTTIVAFYLVGSLFNIVTCVVTIDVVSFVFTNTTFIVPTLSRLLEVPQALIWLPHMPPFNYSKSQIVAFYWVPKMFLLLVIFPQLITLAMFCLIFFRGIFNLFKKHKGQSPSGPIQDFVKVLCQKFRMRRPHIFLIERGEFVTKFSVSPLPGGRDVLLINQLAFEQLSEKELKAVLTHEISHLVHDARAIKLSTWLSRLTLFPNVFLDLAFDWVAREIRADRFALEQTHDPEALMSALQKSPQIIYEARLTKDLQRMRVLKQKTEKRWPILTWITRTRLFIWLGNMAEGMSALYHYLFGEGILGYLHPSTEERLAHIQAHMAVLKRK